MRVCLQGVCRAIGEGRGGMVVFCDRALPGEVLRAQISDVKKGVPHPRAHLEFTEFRV